MESAVLTGGPGRGASPRDAEDDLWRLVQAGFRERRKMLHNVLRAAAADGRPGAHRRRPGGRRHRARPATPDAVRRRLAGARGGARSARRPRRGDGTTGLPIRRGLAAHAKVNLALAVTGRRPDGYHELRSVFLRLELADTLDARRTLGARIERPADRLVVEGDPTAPSRATWCCGRSTAFRAARPTARRSTGAARARSRLHKRIPMGAGLAGGSADAAAALRLLAVVGTRMPRRPADPALAARLGADVPFFLSPARARRLVTGVGERVEPLPPPVEPVGVLLVMPPLALVHAGRVRRLRSRCRRPRRQQAREPVVTALADALRGGARRPPGSSLAPAPAGRQRPVAARRALWTPGLAALRDALEGRLGGRC